MIYFVLQRTFRSGSSAMNGIPITALQALCPNLRPVQSQYAQMGAISALRACGRVLTTDSVCSETKAKAFKFLLIIESPLITQF
jgi:hypothetical protein